MAKPPKGRRSNGSRSRSGGRSGAARAARPQTKRHYPRTARLNTLLQEIVAGYMERLDDDRIGFVTVTGVEVDNDLNRAEVFISTIEAVDGAEAEAEFLDALSEYRKPVQAEIAREARIRKTPEVVFLFDPAVRAGARIEEILSSLSDLGTDADAGSDGDTGGDTGADLGTDADAGSAGDAGGDTGAAAGGVERPGTESNG
ncbi:MAG: 30S ribosome-binding factor RbfA [Acidimicrobiales bacterium]